MAEQDVGIVRAAFEAFNLDWSNRGVGRPREADRFFVDQPEVVPLRAALEGTTFTGASALDDFWTATGDVWAELRIDVERVQREGSGVLVVGTLVGRGRESGAAVETRQAWAAFLRDGKITRIVTLPSERDARRELSAE